MLIICKTHDLNDIKLSSIEITVITLIISYKLLGYENLFLIKNVRKLSKHKGSDHMIKITDNNILPHESLYNLLNTELAVL